MLLMIIKRTLFGFVSTFSLFMQFLLLVVQGFTLYNNKSNLYFISAAYLKVLI